MLDLGMISVTYGPSALASLHSTGKQVDSVSKQDDVAISRGILHPQAGQLDSSFSAGHIRLPSNDPLVYKHDSFLFNLMQPSGDFVTGLTAINYLETGDTSGNLPNQLIRDSPSTVSTWWRLKPIRWMTLVARKLFLRLQTMSGFKHDVPTQQDLWRSCIKTEQNYT